MINDVFGLPLYKSGARNHAATKPVVMEEVKKANGGPALSDPGVTMNASIRTTAWVMTPPLVVIATA